MTILDFIIILALFGFVWFGFGFGFIHAAGGLVGVVIGAWLAGHFYNRLAALPEALFGYSGPWVKLVSFVIIFVIVNRLVGFGFYLLDKSFSFMIHLPFLKTIDRLLGGILGAVEGALVIGLTLTLMLNHLNVPPLVIEVISSSRVAFVLQSFAAILIPLMPEVIRYTQPYLPSDWKIPATTPPIYGR